MMERALQRAESKRGLLGSGSGSSVGGSESNKSMTGYQMMEGNDSTAG